MIDQGQFVQPEQIMDEHELNIENVQTSIQKSFIQGCALSAKLIIPTIVVGSILLCMLYKPYNEMKEILSNKNVYISGMGDIQNGVYGVSMKLDKLLGAYKEVHHIRS